MPYNRSMPFRLTVAANVAASHAATHTATSLRRDAKLLEDLLRAGRMVTMFATPANLIAFAAILSEVDGTEPP